MRLSQSSHNRYTRTSSALTVHWNAPTEWGGCALRLYEIEYRNLSKTAKAKAGTKADARADVPWEALGTVDARLEEFAIFQNVWMCDVRVRARNVGAIVPGPWSKVLHVLSPKEAAEDAIKSRHTPGHAGGGGAGSRPTTASAKERPSSARAADGVAQHGMAVVEPTDLKTEAKVTSLLYTTSLSPTHASLAAHILRTHDHLPFTPPLSGVLETTLSGVHSSRRQATRICRRKAGAPSPSPSAKSSSRRVSTAAATASSSISPLCKWRTSCSARAHPQRPACTFAAGRSHAHLPALPSQLHGRRGRLPR